MTPFHAVTTAVPVPPHTDLKVFRPQNPYVALGLAVSHMMTTPAFANLRFGDWSRILTGQINRKHYYFAVDGKNQIQGFVGWALTSREKAEAWIEGRGALSFGDSLEGDCVIVNAWSASTPEANRFLVSQGREIVEGKHTVYFKRHYKDGRTRAVRLRVKDFSRSTSGDRVAPSEASASQATARSVDSLRLARNVPRPEWMALRLRQI
ncbi:MAG: toxin-activating protein [Microvirga sp.]|jgi:hemolysin-activating ACP:hemolysin acyltransferase|nr:toxin-activating protein [Microvirga sp.]